MGDVVTGVEERAAFCERCGAHGVEQAGDLEACRRCGLLTCPDDRAGAGICRTCAEAARLSARRAGLQMARPVPPTPTPLAQSLPPAPSPPLASASRSGTAPVSATTGAVSATTGAVSATTGAVAATGPETRRRRLLLGTLSLAALATVLAIVAAGSLESAGSGRTVDVAGADAASGVPAGGGAAIGVPGMTPPGTGATSPGATPSTARAGTTNAGVDLGATGLPTWRDVLGAWHGQALVAVRNRGSHAVLVDAAGSRYAVTRPDGSRLAAGGFQAAVPPVLQPGATGYLVAGFTLVDPPGDGVKLHATPAVAPVDVNAAPVALPLSAVEVAFGADTVAATGSVGNPRATSVRDGVVAVILLDRAGRPLAGMLDLASAGRLARGERVAFHATQPPVPPVDRRTVQRRIAVAWAAPAP